MYGRIGVFVLGHHLLRRRVAARPDAPTREGVREALGARHAEVGDLEDLGLAEAAAQHVAGREIAVDDAHRVDRREARGEATERVRRSDRIEGVAGAVHRVGDAILEGGALDAAVDVLDRNPGVGVSSKMAVAPVSMKRTTNGHGGMCSFRRPSATASLCAKISAVRFGSISPGFTSFTTTTDSPSGERRAARYTTPIAPSPTCRISR